jgi:hypothetical protein
MIWVYNNEKSHRNPLVAWDFLIHSACRASCYFTTSVVFCPCWAWPGRSQMIV